MAKVIKIKKGLDIPIQGSATDIENPPRANCSLFGICPDDFPGFKWRLQVKEGDKVAIGATLLMDKADHGICIVSPVNGTIKAVVRGERRKIEYVEIEASDTAASAPMEVAGLSPAEVLLKSGLWALMRQRPFDIIPTPGVEPRDIFVTAFDTAPLAPQLIHNSNHSLLENGLKVLSGLTPGKVYLNTRFGAGVTSAYAEVTEFAGPHPAGNIGVQISKIRPVNKGETVWTLDARTVERIGRLFADHELSFLTNVALTGPQMPEPKMVSTLPGADINALIPQLKQMKGVAVISGNLLTGIREDGPERWLRYPYRQVTLIESGEDREDMLGWASLDPHKYSVKRSFPGWLKRHTPGFSFDTRLRGGRRAPILSGEYDKVLPMDIYAEYLLKAIEAKDIDRMEKLGIYEVAPEDFALPEFVDTSKQPLQQIVRDGLDYLHNEL